MKLRRKPVEIQGWPMSLILGQMEHDWESLPPEVARGYDEGTLRAPTRRTLTVVTTSGPVLATNTDWLLLGVDGEFYPCPGETLAELYELSED